MPQGKGTYGEQVGRPPKKAMGGKIINPPEPIEQIMPEFDARNRSQLTPGFGDNFEPLNTNPYEDQYSDMPQGPPVGFKQGGKIKKK